MIVTASQLYLYELQHPRLAAQLRDLAAALHAGYAWGLFYTPPFFSRKPAPRDPSWEAVQIRTAERAAELGIKVVN